MHPDRSSQATDRSASRLDVFPRLALALLTLVLLHACSPGDRAAESGGGRADGSEGRAGAGTGGSRVDPSMSGQLTVTDGAGRTVTLHAPAQRVVSMMPSVTEWIIAMGAADRLVARTDYDDHPAVDTLPSVGGGLTPSVEWLAARHPDLVVAWPDAPSRSLVARLEALGLPVYAAPSETVGAGLATARDLGTLLARDSAATAAVAEVEAGLDSVTAAVAGRDRPGVLFLIGLDPIMAAGPGTFVDQLVDRAGGRNVLADVTTLWPQISLEEIVRRAPEVVIVGSVAQPDPLAALQRRPGWRDVPAVHSGRVHPVDPNLVNRPGPRMDEAAAILARLIHGDSPALPAVTDPTLDPADPGAGP